MDEAGKRVPDDESYVLEGCWDFTFPLYLSDSSVTLDESACVTVDGVVYPLPKE